MAKKIDLASAPRRTGTSYPPPYDTPCERRRRVRLGAAAGLTQMGANLLTLPPGQWSSQRHWHKTQDELVYVLDGEVVLVTNEGEETLRAGDSVGFPAGKADGHHFQNRGDRDALLLEMGTSTPGDEVDYPDIDLRHDGTSYVHRDGTRY